MDEQWSLQDAKNKFSEVVNAALQGRPQLVTRRGEPAVVVLSAEDYEEMLRREKLAASSFTQFLLSMPTGPDDEGAEEYSPLAPREVEW